MEENEPLKKQPLVLDFDKLINDEPPADLVRKRSPEAPVETVMESREFAGYSDASIEENIQKSERLLKLPLKDNGDKVRARLKLLEAEKERRRLLPVNDDGPEKMMQSKGLNFTCASGDSMDTMSSSRKHSQSEFGTIFSSKLDENRTESRQVNAFEDELSYVGFGGKRSERLKKQNSTNGKQYSMMSLKQSPFSCPTKLSVDSKQRNISNGDQIRHSSTRVSQKVIPPDSFTKKKRPFPSLSLRDLRPKKGSDYVLVDEEEPEPDLVECMEQPEEVDEGFDEDMKDCSIYYPSRDDPESEVINYSDLKCLAPQAYLSSTIMNFYILHLQQPTLATERGSNDYHFFNTYFYSKLTEAVSKNEKESFLKFRRWWKGVDIFRKAYILLPVHESVHWSLVIICIPDKEEDSGPIILHLDSLGFHSSRSIFDNVKSFLKEEWTHLNEGEVPRDLPISDSVWNRLPRKIEEKRIEVPQQRNDYDCGLFVLYFIERFIVEAPQRLKKNDLAMFGKKWFKHEDASNLRIKIKKLLMEEFKKSTQDDCSPTESTTMAAQEQKIEQPVDISKFILV